MRLFWTVVGRAAPEFDTAKPCAAMRDGVWGTRGPPRAGGAVAHVGTPAHADGIKRR